ncbi:MAG: ornithine carbamoyltransferase [Chloroflexota bacterium]|nr:MAG: ornithine carbamoyltransferase [Chloroflexota bacterium]
MRDFLSIADLTRNDLELLLQRARDIKRDNPMPSLAGKHLALVFQKPSLRTRVSFEVGMRQLGGEALYLTSAEVGMGVREPIKDVARVLSRYVDVIAARTFAQTDIEELAEHASVPVINALSDDEHPCQALADLLTLQEKLEDLRGVTLAYVGDGNNVAASLALGASLLGMSFHIATPPGYELAAHFIRLASENAAQSGAQLLQTNDPCEAVANADAVYTDVWASMGQESERETRRAAFQAYQINADLLSHARRRPLIMHDLPAHRGEEITDDVFESDRSVIFDQAENRLHAQKAVLHRLLVGA